MGVDEETIRGFRNVLLKIFDEQKSAWSPENQSEHKPSKSARELYNQYCYTHWHPIEGREFETWLNSPVEEVDSRDDSNGEKESNGDPAEEINIDFSARKAILILPPLLKNPDFVPILNLNCKLNRRQNSLRLYVLMVRLDDANKLQGIGFRFESPEIEQYAYTENEDQETKANEGLHDFYHAQLITGFNYGPPVEIPIWLPVTQPSFPLPADDPITLVFALLLTFYGKKYCWEFYSNHRSNLPELSSRIEKMNAWIGWQAFEQGK